ncbi:hypothetical protein [Rhodoblastus sp.]|uniref:hypothetical protein n=1 Tax=Rhodoblastus sp. TaxID=1962975 RepID=UPI00260653C0|nr:hypothetical protein [Rhodoblastus sp.]
MEVFGRFRGQAPADCAAIVFSLSGVERSADHIGERRANELQPLGLRQETARVFRAFAGAITQMSVSSGLEVDNFGHDVEPIRASQFLRIQE